MTTIRRFVCDDLLRFNNVNLDPLTETARLLRAHLCALRPDAPPRRSTTCRFTCSTWRSGRSTSCSPRRPAARAKATVRAPRTRAAAPGRPRSPASAQSWARRRAKARTGTATSQPSRCGAAACATAGLAVCMLTRSAGGARVPPPGAGAEADGHTGGDHHQKARALRACCGRCAPGQNTSPVLSADASRRGRQTAQA